MNDSEDNVDREIEESKRFFSRFPPVAHHNNPMVQYSHLGKKYEIVFSSLKVKSIVFLVHKCHCTWLISIRCEYDSIKKIIF